MTKLKKSDSTVIALNRKQMDQLSQFIHHFKDVEWITLESESTGIGPVVRVKCSLFGNDSEPETIIDITDTKSW